MAQAPRKPNVDELGGVADDGVQHTGMRPLRRAIARFFKQFTLRAQPTVFTGVELTGRKLDHHLLHGIAELALHHQAAIVVHGNHHHCAGMNDKLACGSVAVGQTYRVTKSMQEMTFEQLGVV